MLSYSNSNGKYFIFEAKPSRGLTLRSGVDSIALDTKEGEIESGRMKAQDHQDRVS